ncbi:adenylate/guanylate cyclase domain-containing protein [Gammaproteobacteria bacterium]|nr:adenylate/guanylate cyclase domain-containing protein [Gammaproteobacteria bacterium]
MAKEHLAGTLAVILHADIAGSTALVQEDKELAHERIQDTFRRFSLTIEKYQGHVLELRGDALLAEFKRASDAVSAALSFQIDHVYYNNQLEDDLRPGVRVGIAMGEVIIADNTVTGAGVVQAQRVEQLADPGGVCITTAIHEALSRRIPINLESLGEKALKGFDHPIGVYRVELIPGEPLPLPAGMPQDSLLPKSRRLAVAFVTITLIVAGGSAYWVQSRIPQMETASIEHMASSLPDKPSIAVLPFNNLSDDSQQEYFVDGLTEDLITDLSQVSGLFVIARNSVFTYKGRAVKVQDVAEDLGVNHVLEGSVRREGERLRINAQLINAISGHHVWAERFDRELTDVFALQDEVIKKIVTALKVELTDAEKGGLEKRYTDSIEAYDLFLKGQRAFFEFTREGNQAARDLYREAVELDPKFARAWANLGWTHARDYQDGWSESPEDSLDTALALTKKGSKLDPTSSQVHWVLGQVLLFRQEYERALEAVRKAIELSPGNADARILLARILAFSGDPKESIRLIEEAMRINPYYPMQYQMNAGIAYFADGNYIKAESALIEAADRNPGAQRVRMWLAATYANAGKIEEAAWELQELMTLNPSFSVKSIERSIPFRDVTVRDRLVNGLRLANN